jgi:uncharacterized repeat protein (TIGR01451 family)
VRTRIAATIGIVVFLVLSGAGISFAYWTTSAQTTATVAVASPSTTNCSSIVKLTNGGFESPDVSPAAYQQYPVSGGAVPGWLVQNDTIIEIWRSQLGSTPPEGAQIAELNGTGFGTLYQDVVTTPGQTLRWSIVHRGRDGTDAMRVSINASSGALVPQEEWSTTPAAFVRHEGAYVVPAGQTSTRISLTPVSTFNNNVSIGNLIDDVTFGTGPCVQSTSTVTNITRGGSNFYSGDVVEYVTTAVNNGGNHALGSTYSLVVPTTLTYQAGTLQISGTARTDATADDQADYVGGTRTITARVGTGATTTAGGSMSPSNSVTVRFRATIQASGVGTAIPIAPTMAYADPLAPSWPISTTATPVSITPAANGADIAVAVLTSPNLAPSASRTWTFRVTNNGPDAASNVRVAVTIPTGLTVASGGVTATTATCDATGTTRNCIFTGTLAVGATRDITVTGTLPSTLSGTYGVIAATNPQVTPATTTDPVAGNNSATNSGILDTTAPSTPTGLTVGTTTATTVPLSWTASTDAVGVTDYRVYRNGVLVGTSGGATTYTDTGRTAGQAYWYWVVAVDAAGNASGASTGVGAITTFGAGRYLMNYPALGTRCIGAAGTADDNLVQVLTCNTGSNPQRWQFTVSGTGYVLSLPMEGLSASRMLDLVTQTPVSGTDAKADNDATTNSRVWVPFVDWDSATSQTYIGFRNVLAPTLCLEVTGGATTVGTQVQVATCAAGTAQRFRLTAS